MKKYSNEFKVGLFFLACIFGLIYLLYSTGKLNFKKDGYHIYVVFDEVAGLEKKAPVMLNGLEVGKIEDIQVSYAPDKTSVILKLWLETHARIRNDPVISIKTLGLMGEKYIQISSNTGTDFILAGATLTGKPYKDIDVLMDQVEVISRGMDDLVKEIDSLVENINTAVTDNQGGVKQIIKNLETSSQNFADFSADIKAHPWKLLIKGKEKKAK